ncbi:MAG: pentapeptide repeat-containing protein [Pseudomonadota bacterium]
MSSDDQSNYKPNALSRAYEAIGNRIIDRERRAWLVEWLRRNYLWIIVTIGLIAYLILTAIVTWELPFLADAALEKLSDELDDEGAEFDSDVVRNLAYAIGALLGGVALIATVPFQLIKTWMNERQAVTSEQGHITDRFTKAIGQLGEEKTVKVIVPETDDQGIEREVTRERTEPNLEVRLGAIYALERIAQDSERDHIPIMETLSAYIRQNTRAEAPRDFPLPPFPDRLDDDADEAAHERRAADVKARTREISAWVEGLGPAHPPRDDVRAVLRVIERRGDPRRAFEDAQEPAFRIDLVRANLQRTDLSRVRLDKTNLTEARLEGAVLRWARLEGANLSWARLERADLRGARLERADLRGARLERANLIGARLEGADLREARLEGANLIGADLKSTDLRDWSIVRTSLRSVDFTDAMNLSPESLNTAFGDATTTLPEGMEKPDHWDRGGTPRNVFSLEDDAVYQQWLREHGDRAGSRG